VLQYCDKIVSPSGEVTPLSDEEKEEIRVDVIENFASQGLRTICLAYGDVSPQENPEEPPEQGLTCIGIVGIKVPFALWPLIEGFRRVHVWTTYATTITGSCSQGSTRCCG
jgi:hypothetical protein